MKCQLVKLVLILSLLFSLTNTFAQEFQGVATYRSARKSLSANPTEGKDDKINAEVIDMINKAFQKEFTLVFNRNESIFKVNESLERPNPANGNGNINASYPYELIYKNTKENRLSMVREVFGKKFLIKDSIQKKAWRIINETKTIGEYLCTKAVITKSYKKRIVGEDGSFKFIDQNSDLIVWFTMEIPVNHGPSIYYGLPGLVLEVEDGRSTFLCTKIIINPEEKLKIEEPSKGKVVSQINFDKIFEAKMNENKENFKNRSRN